MVDSRHTGMQIYSNPSVITKLPLLVRNLGNEQVKVFCKEMSKRLRLKVTDEIASGLRCVGGFSPVSETSMCIQNELSVHSVLYSACPISSCACSNYPKHIAIVKPCTTSPVFENHNPVFENHNVPVTHILKCCHS